MDVGTQLRHSLTGEETARCRAHLPMREFYSTLHLSPEHTHPPWQIFLLRRYVETDVKLAGPSLKSKKDRLGGTERQTRYPLSFNRGSREGMMSVGTQPRNSLARAGTDRCRAHLLMEMFCWTLHLYLRCTHLLTAPSVAERTDGKAAVMYLSYCVIFKR